MIRLIGRPARTASFRHRSINRNSAVASGSSFFNGWRSTPGTTPLTSQLALLISTTTTKVEIGSNALTLRLRSLTWATGQPPSVHMDDEGATTSAARPIASLLLLGIAAPNSTRADIGADRAQLLLEPWAVQAALSRRRGGNRLTDSERDAIRRCTCDPDSLRWPRGTD